MIVNIIDQLEEQQAIQAQIYLQIAYDLDYDSINFNYILLNKKTLIVQTIQKQIQQNHTQYIQFVIVQFYSIFFFILWIKFIQIIFIGLYIISINKFIIYNNITISMWPIQCSSKNKSQKSTTPQQFYDKKYAIYIEELRKQNEYKKKALETAENLIKSYQKQNEELKADNIRLKQIITFKRDEVKLMREILIENSLSTQNFVKHREQKQNKIYEQKQFKKLTDKIDSLLQNKKILENKISIIQEKMNQIYNIHQNRPQDIIQEIKGQSTSQIVKNKDNFETRINKIHKQTNLTQLRALHMKLKVKQADEYGQNNKKINEIVASIFSSQKRLYETPRKNRCGSSKLKSQKKQNNYINSDNRRKNKSNKKSIPKQAK